MSEAFDRAQEAQDRSHQLMQSIQTFRRFIRLWFFILVFVVFGLSLHFQFSNVPTIILLGLLLISQVVFQISIVRLRHQHDALAETISEIYVSEKSKSPQTCGSMDPHLTQAR